MLDSIPYAVALVIASGCALSGFRYWCDIHTRAATGELIKQVADITEAHVTLSAEVAKLKSDVGAISITKDHAAPQYARGLTLPQKPPRSR